MTDLFEPNTIDSVDFDVEYMKRVVEFSWWDAKWDNYNDWFENIALPKLKTLNLEGTCIFAGVYTGEDYIQMQELNIDLIGIDIVHYNKDIDHIIGDVREVLPNMDEKITMFWNGIGPWPWSRESKMACFEYAKRYLKSGGYYYDHLNTSEDAPEIINDKDFEVIDIDFLLMRKK